MMKLIQPYGAIAAAFCLAVCVIAAPATVIAEQQADQVSPEFATGATQKKLVRSKRFMVSAANPHASRAGHDILAAGGSAVDAMVAVQLVLGLVEPQSSGLGGGAFAVLWDAKAKQLSTLDGRETAPMASDGNLFIGSDGNPMGFFDAVIGGRSVGTPGTVALLHEAHKMHGRLDWASLFEPAIALAENGFEVSPRLNALITRSAESLYTFETARNYFLSEEGVPLFAGTRLINQAYADTLRRIANQGPQAFYTGEIAADIVATVQGAPGNPGLLSLEDMAVYEIKQRDAVCVDYRGYQVCGMGPPSSGGLTVGQILKLLEPYDLSALGPANPQSWRLIGDASRLGFADRGLYMADSDFVKMPKGLLNSGYLAARSKLLTGSAALARAAVKPGKPPTDHALNFTTGSGPDLPATSHFSIVDEQGNVVSMTTTIENGFGSRLMVRGFLLNNELTDFSFVPQKDGVAVANRVEPGKRPRSSMAPTIVLRDGKPVLAIGSPGGSRIIPYVAKTLIAWIDWDMDVQQAIELPHLVNRFGIYDLEAGTTAESFKGPLETLGYDTAIRDLNSGLHGIEISDDGLAGGADPRREGLVIGQ